MIGKQVIFKNKNFNIIKLLGKGKSAYSYLIEKDGQKFVLKKMHNEPCSYYHFGDNKLKAELSAYYKLKATGIRIPELVEYNDAERYLIKEFIEGETIAEIVAKGSLQENLIQQIFKMTKKLYSNDINIDYFPTNFVVQRHELVYIDYEFNPYSDEWNFENWGIYYWINSKGMKAFLETGDHRKINIDDDSGKPITEAFQMIAEDLILKFSKNS